MSNLVNDLKYVKNTLIQEDELFSEDIQLSLEDDNQSKADIIKSRILHTIKFVIPLLLFFEIYDIIFGSLPNLATYIYGITNEIFELTQLRIYTIQLYLFNTLSVIIFIYCIYKVLFGFNKRKIKYKESNNESEIKKTELKLNNIYIKEYPKMKKIISQKYWNTLIIDRLINYLSTGRADSLKEAINLFEAENQQKRLEDQLSGIAYSSAKRTREIQDLKRKF